MKVITTQSDLNHALKLVGRAVGDGRSHPILADVLIDAMADGYLQISAFDLELGITTKILASIETPGSIAIPYRILYEIVGRLGTDAAIFLAAEDTAVTLSSASGSYKLAGHEPGDFPSFPVVDTAAAVSVAIAEPTRAALVAVSSEESKGNACGMHVAIADGTMRVEATDGHRLVIRTEPADGAIDIILPTRAISAIQRLDSAQVKLSASNNQAMITADDTTITSRIFAGVYFDVAKLIPGKFKSSLTVGRIELIAALERLMVVNAKNAHFAAKAKNLSITAESEISSGSETLACTGTFAGATMNTRYLLDGLKHFDSANVQISSNSPTTPVVLTPTGVSGQTYLVMPIKTKV